MKESKVEKYLDAQIKKLGGFTRKYVSPQHTGVPDRICFLPRGLVMFIEVKTDTGKISTAQQREAERITNLDICCYFCFGIAGVDSIINWLKEERGYVTTK